MEVRYKGETTTIKVTVKVNDVVADLNGYTGIVFIVYVESGKVLQKYSRDVLAGHDSINFKVIDAAAGRFNIIIQPSITLTANTDDYKGEIQVQKADADMELSTWKKIAGDITLFRLKDAKSKNTGVA